MAFVRMFVIVVAVLTVFYICLYFYLLDRERDRLDRDYQSGAGDAERRRFVDARVRAYADRLRPRLALGVYAVPLTVLAVYIWVSN